jgi:hypothetical protein
MQQRVASDRSVVLALLVMLGGSAALVASFLPWVWVNDPGIPSAGIQQGAGGVTLVCAGLVLVQGAVAVLRPSIRPVIYTSALLCAVGIAYVALIVVLNPWRFLGLDGPCCMLTHAAVQPAAYVTLAGGIIAASASLRGALA